MESGSKKYGLLVPKKKLGSVKASNVFGNDSESDNESKNKPIQTSNRTKAQQRSAKLIHDMAIEEDATVFQYDEVYDEMEKKKGNLGEKKKEVDKKPRYIENLLIQAEKRKIEYERRNERLIQKERETEGNEFDDKEAFVTSSYKKKLEELKKMDEEDLKMSMIEDINDVTKQRDMGSFYRHLFKSELCKNENDNKIDNDDDDNDNKKKPKKTDANRQYRKRASSNSSDDKDTDLSDSDSSVDSSKRQKLESHNEEDDKEDADKPKVKLEEKQLNEEKSKVKLESPNDETELREKVTKNISEDKKSEKNESKPKEIVQKINIWEKRTIGDIYEAARQRFFERKMKRINLHTQS